MQQCASDTAVVLQKLAERQYLFRFKTDSKRQAEFPASLPEN